MTSAPDIAIEQFLAKHPLGDMPSGCFVGFSGGCDSTALLTALHAHSALRNALTAVHFQHGIRGDSAEKDAAWCAEFCRERGIPFRLFRLNVPQTRRRGESIEQCARRRRLEAWEELRRECGLDELPVFLAHHQDDAMEDLFLRLGRGANASGLTALRPVRRLHALLLLRPFLHLRKDELATYLRDRHITDWRSDETNDDDTYRRNAVRNRLLPLFREIFQGDQPLIHTLDALSDDARFLEDAARQALPSVGDAETSARTYPLSAWQTLPQALLPRVLRMALTRHFGDDDIPVTRDALVRVRTALDTVRNAPLTVPITRRIMLRVSQNGVSFSTAGTAAVPAFQPIRWNWQESPAMELPELGWYLTATPAVPAGIMLEACFVPSGAVFRERFSADTLPPMLTVRTWRHGDAMRPFGADYHKKVQDIFTDAKIPRDKRPRLPVILADDAIIWIPGVRRAEFGRMSH